MNANDFTFGIEIETIIDREKANENGLAIGSYHRGVAVAYLPDGWTASRDGSLQGGENDLPCEIVSPVLQGAEGLEQVAKVARILRAKGHRVNATCGVHVHVGIGDANDATSRLQSQSKRLIKIVSYLEKGIYATTGTKNRERGRYCRGLREFGDENVAAEQIGRDRYRILNVTNLKTGRRPTFEFRAFSGSLNPVKLAGWIQLCVGLVHRTFDSKRLPVWAPKEAQGGWRKNGIGQTDVERIFGFLGWGAGYARLKRGVQFGWLGDAVDQDAIKAEFRRLAKRYDAQN